MVLPFQAQRPRRDRRPRRRPAQFAPETLEGRVVLNYSPLGYSPPDLTVVGTAPAVAAYGGTITVDVDYVNLGHSSLIEPMNQEQGSPSLSDAGPSVVGVYLSPNPNKLTTRAIFLGEIEVPYIRQDSVLNLTATFNMPATRPQGFPGNGRDLYVYFRANSNDDVVELDTTNNVTRAPEPVQLAAALPELVATAIEVPSFMQPGDVINPAFRIANFGTTTIAPQGPLLVQIVASTDQNYGPTDVVLASYTIEDIPPLSTVPTRSPIVLGDVTLDPQNNVLTVNGPNFQLPASPSRYFVGIVVDPLNQIRELSEIGRLPSPRLEMIREVGPRISLPPAGVVTSPASGLNVFPIPAFGEITAPYFPDTSTIVPTGAVGSSASTTQARRVTASLAGQSRGAGSVLGGLGAGTPVGPLSGRRQGGR